VRWELHPPDRTPPRQPQAKSVAPSQPPFVGHVRAPEPQQPPQTANIRREEDLGSRTIEGIVAEGTRVTVTIPPGAIGNERAIESVTERWFSPELRIVILSRRPDPRFGETTYRLTNITRSEPPASLFEKPQ
jgi:hypothetical protein